MPLIIFMFFSLTGCTGAITYKAETKEKPSVKVETINELNKYEIELKYDVTKRTALGHQKLIYKNNEGVELSDLVFHLYPNAYKAIGTVPAIGSPEKCFPDGFNPGYIEVSNIRVNGKSVNHKISGMVLNITLNNAIKADEKAEIDMDFTIKIPNSTGRFGTYNGTSQFVYWNPILAVYDKGWQIREYKIIGESNYSEVADYNVKITLPQEQKVASTGVIASEAKIKEKGLKIVNIDANNVRDFTWVCNKDFIIEEKEVDGIKIKSFFTAKNAALGSKADDIGVDVFKYYNKLFGKYPYEEFDIVETYLTGGGMEYPQLISLGQGHYQQQDSLEHVIAHEIAHQWWYVTVGNDEYTYPWLDEGFATYSTDMYTSSKSKLKGTLEVMMTKYYAAKVPNIAINSSVEKFSSWSEYSPTIYRRGATTLHSLRSRIGDEQFFKIMKMYYLEYKFKNAGTDDFIGVVEKVSGKEAAEELKKLVNRSGK